MQIKQLDGGIVELSDAALEELRKVFRGSLITAADDQFEGARKVWNGMIDRRPRLIAQCAGAADVISAVNFARIHGLLVAIRGGGHSWPGHSDAGCAG
jgi:FAD/FMN-containing dehydrogenase